MRARIGVRFLVVGTLLFLTSCITMSNEAGGGNANARNVAQPGAQPPRPTGAAPQRAPNGPSQPMQPSTPVRPGGIATGGQPTASCDNPAGTFRAVRVRSQSNPGSCPPTENNFDADFPVRVTWDGTKPSAYKVEVGYSNPQTYAHDFVECVNNKNQCDMYATCDASAGYRDQFRFTLNGNSLTGSVQRMNMRTGCTINLDVRGSRPLGTCSGSVLDTSYATLEQRLGRGRLTLFSCERLG